MRESQKNFFLLEERTNEFPVQIIQMFLGFQMETFGTWFEDAATFTGLLFRPLRGRPSFVKPARTERAMNENLASFFVDKIRKGKFLAAFSTFDEGHYKSSYWVRRNKKIILATTVHWQEEKLNFILTPTTYVHLIRVKLTRDFSWVIIRVAMNGHFWVRRKEKIILFGQTKVTHENPQNAYREKNSSNP